MVFNRHYFSRFFIKIFVIFLVLYVNFVDATDYIYTEQYNNDYDDVPIDVYAVTHPDEFFTISTISPELLERINGKSYKEFCKFPVSDLRYLTVLHKNINGRTIRGELIVNKYIAKDVINIFKILYRESYPIEKIKLIDDYDADDQRSMEDNNSSAFNCRYISNTTKLSKHALGLAIDINTKYNPYVKTLEDGTLVIEPKNATKYVDRSRNFKYKVSLNDDAYKAFISKGFIWGGGWKSVKDYQHFELNDEHTKELYPNDR
ncbi:MAG: M15 family metallopeptidase [Succinivibrionaceae bacterium]